MQEIERILNNNMGNRLTPELVIGLHSMISHHVNAMIKNAADAQKAVAPDPVVKPELAGE